MGQGPWPSPGGKQKKARPGLSHFEWARGALPIRPARIRQQRRWAAPASCPVSTILPSMGGRELRARSSVNYSEKAPDVGTTPAWLRKATPLTPPSPSQEDKENLQASHADATKPGAKGKQSRGKASAAAPASKHAVPTTSSQGEHLAPCRIHVGPASRHGAWPSQRMHGLDIACRGSGSVVPRNLPAPPHPRACPTGSLQARRGSEGGQGGVPPRKAQGRPRRVRRGGRSAGRIRRRSQARKVQAGVPGGRAGVWASRACRVLWHVGLGLGGPSLAGPLCRHLGPRVVPHSPAWAQAAPRGHGSKVAGCGRSPALGRPAGRAQEACHAPGLSPGLPGMQAFWGSRARPPWRGNIPCVQHLAPHLRSPRPSTLLSRRTLMPCSGSTRSSRPPSWMRR